MAVWLSQSAQKYPENSEHLIEAIQVAAEAEKIILPPGDIWVSIVLKWSQCLYLRYQREGNFKDLIEAIGIVREGVPSISDSHPRYEDMVVLQLSLDQRLGDLKGNTGVRDFLAEHQRVDLLPSSSSDSSSDS
jgi:hypothetical protein